jgi:DNA polymerase-3 subunit alpha
MCNNFVPLHLHTDYSGDGLGTIENMFQYASEKGFTSLAITDHATCGGHVEFWSAANAHDIKPIFGNEIYYMHNGRRGHLTILSSGKVGYENLIGLNNASQINKERGFPLTTLELLDKYNKGLIVLSGCSASPLYFGDENDALLWASQIYDIFGSERFYAEVMGVFTEDNYSRPSMIAKRFGLTKVVTTDTHFVRKQDFKAHRIACISRKGFDYSSQELWLKTRDEILGTKWLTAKASQAQLEELLDNTVALAEKIEAFDLSAPAKLPKTDGSIDIVSLVGGKKIASNYKKRLDYETGVIVKQGLVDYFTILFDLVSFCKDKNIKVGPGRGSGAGSLFLYLLGITDVDPIENGLIFERFLDVNRSDMPDFDLDIQADRRDEVIEYMNKKWGGLPVANYSTYSHSSLIRDIGRFYSVPLALVGETSDSESEEQLEKFFAACNTVHTSGGETIKFSPEDARRAYKVMLGQVRHRGKHAAGVVVVTRSVPIEDEKVAWYEGIKSRQLTQVGLVKYDILGVSALSILAELERTTGKTPVENDHKVFTEVFCSGKLDGIFQFSGSAGIAELTMKVQPKSINDLSAINALYRPGPMDSGMMQKYPDYIANPRKIHPKIDEILAETNGVMIYQEQVMAIVAVVTGGNLADADKARKIISKGKKGDPIWEGKLRELEEHFKNEGVKNFPKNIVNMLWKEIVTFGRYGFNKSHSISYSILSYRMAWYKLYFPGYYYAALLNNDSERANEWLIAAALSGVKLKMPDVNFSGLNWIFDSGTLFAPLTALKFFGEKQVSAFLEERNKMPNKKFDSLDELNKVPRRILNERVRKQLFIANSLSSLTGDIRSFIGDIDEVVSLTKIEREMQSIGFRLPDKDFVDFFTKETSQGRVAGFVSSKEKRNKGRGDYYVIKLNPAKTFWTKNVNAAEKISESDLISADVNNGGEAKNIWRKK